MKRLSCNTNLRCSKGFSLVELMIAMLLGLILVGAAVGVMFSNMQSFRAAQDIAQMQDSARLGFELMARDIRQAGSIPCGNDITIENIVFFDKDDIPWYLDWEAGAKGQLIGYTNGSVLSKLNTAGEGKIAGAAQALTILYANNTGASLEKENILASTAHGLHTGDIAVICNATKGRIFKAQIDGKKLSARLNDDTTQMLNDYEKNAVISKLKSRAWYIGENTQGGSSLYMAKHIDTDNVQRIEIASGVTDLQLHYHLKGEPNFKVADDLSDSDWLKVNAIQITLILDDGTQAAYSFSSIVAARNHSL